MNNELPVTGKFMQDPDVTNRAPVGPSSNAHRCPICSLVQCDEHSVRLRNTTVLNTDVDANSRFAPDLIDNNTDPSQVVSNLPHNQTVSNQTTTMQSCATENPTLLQQTTKAIQEYNSNVAQSNPSDTLVDHQEQPKPSTSPATDADIKVIAPLTQTNINLSQKSAKTIVLSSVGSLTSSSLPLPPLTSPKSASNVTNSRATTNITPNNANSHMHQLNTKNTQQSSLKNVSAKPAEEQKQIVLETMGALPPVAARDSAISPLTIAQHAPMPADSPSPTPIDIIAPASQRTATVVSAPQNYNTQAAQFNDNTINGRRVFGSKYRFNISQSKLQESSRFITVRIIPDPINPWEEVTSGSQALSYLHALSTLMNQQHDHVYPCWSRLKPTMILNCAVEQTGLLYAIDTNWIGTDNLADFTEMVTQEFQDYANSVQMTVFGKTPNICDLRVPWDLTDNYTIVWVTAGMQSDNLVAAKNMVGQHQAFILECYDIATAFGLEAKLAYGERGTTATKTVELRDQGQPRELAADEKQDRTYNLGYKLVFDNLTEEEKSNLMHLQSQPWYGYNFRYSVEKPDTTAKRALKLIPGCELCFQLHLPHQNCDETEPARKEAIAAIKRQLRLSHPNAGNAEMSNLIYDAVSKLSACARCAGYHEQDLYHEDGMCPHALSAQSCKFCMTNEFEQQTALNHDTEKSLRCLRMRADAITFVNRNHRIKQDTWKHECQHYNITPQSLALRTNIEMITQKMNAINMNAPATSPVPPHKYLITRQSVPTPHAPQTRPLPPQVASQGPINPRKPPLRQQPKLNPNAPTYDPYTPHPPPLRAPPPRSNNAPAALPNRVWNGTTLDSITEDNATTVHQGFKSPLYGPYIPLHKPPVYGPNRSMSSNATTAFDSSPKNNNLNLPETSPIKSKSKRRRKTRRGGGINPPVYLQNPIKHHKD